MSAQDQIRQFAERIVRLEEERKALAADIKDLKAEAKAAGLSPKLIATCARILMMEAEKRAEALSGHEELDLYLSAVGLVAERVDHETRHDGGGSGYAGSAMAARAAARDEAGADVIRETDTAAPAPQVSRDGASGTRGGTGDDCSVGKRGAWPPQGGASSSRGNDSPEVVTAGETAPNSPVWHGAAEGAPRPGGECGSIPRRAPAHSHGGSL